ncbi:MAG: hypothetical protein R3250_09420 [Melioribacteraceae bacterium]|nr:hypothetical protein [Melioribacteraceae bacterium]
MSKMNKESKMFPPKSFSDSPVKDVFDAGEFNIAWLDKTKENADIYTTFNEIFKLYLSKLPSNNVKKYVDFVFKKGLVFVGFSVAKSPIVFNRILLTKQDKVAGIVLDSSDLDIDLVTGETDRVDDCIYATYYGLLRAAVISGNGAIKTDKDLNKNLAIYVNQIVLRSLGKGIVYNAEQKDLIFGACTYLYHRHFLSQKHPMALVKVKNDYKDVINQKSIDKVIEILDKTSKYSTIKDISRLLVDLKIVTTNPNQVMLSMLKQLGSTGFYCFVGSLDYFLASVVLARYPTGLFPKTMMVSDKLHNTVETIASKYLGKVGYDVTAVKREF